MGVGKTPKNLPKLLSSSDPDMLQPSPSKELFRILRAAESTASHAIWASTAPTLTLRTPRSANSATVKLDSRISTLNGLGATARTIETISRLFLTPGACKQSAGFGERHKSVACLIAVGSIRSPSVWATRTTSSSCDQWTHELPECARKLGASRRCGFWPPHRGPRSKSPLRLCRRLRPRSRPLLPDLLRNRIHSPLSQVNQPFRIGMRDVPVRRQK